jgi:L-asparaginase
VVEPLTVVATRGDVVEARHLVHAVAVQDGRIVEAMGDPLLVSHFRSAAKPIQALPLVRMRPDLDNAEIAIACASHRAQPEQLEAVRSLLAKAPASVDELECGPEPTPLEHNCSGKHAGFLALCRMRGWPSPGYRLRDHPCQRELVAELAGAADVDPASMPIATDGCGVVTVGLPLERMAYAFARLPDLDAGERTLAAMRAHPDLIRGPVAADSMLMRLLAGWTAKGGAEGLLCAVTSDRTGIAVKVEDGAQRAVRPALAEFLRRLGYDTRELGEVPVRNSRGETVGELRVRG